MNLNEQEKKGDKEPIIKIVFWAIGTLIVFLLILFVVRMIVYKTTTYENDETNSNIDKEFDYDNYVYRIKYYMGDDIYLYLLPDNTIKTIEVVEPLEPTGRSIYEEKTVTFSDEAKKIAIGVLDELYRKAAKKAFDANDLELTKYQERILLAIIFDSEDNITIENDLDYEIISEELSSKNNDYKIINSKVILNNTTKNKVVNKIADYLNKITEDGFNKISAKSKEVIENTDIKENSGVNQKIKLVYAGSNYLSFVYTEKGQIGTSAVYNLKGYTFRYNGDIFEFDLNGLKEKYFERAVSNFMRTDLYKNYKERLYGNWESILYDNMYLTGNWYINNEKLEFLIPAHLLGLDESATIIVKINAKIDDEDF